MVEKINTLVIAVLFGSLLLLSFLLFSNPLKVNRRGNLWFGCSVFLWSTFWLDEIMELTFGFGIGYSPPLGLVFIQFLAPVLYFYSVYFFIKPTYRFQYSDLFCLIVPALYLVILIVEKKTGTAPFLSTVKLGLIIGQTLFFSIFIFLKIKTYQRQIEHFASNTSEISLKWLEYILYLILALVVVVSIYNLVFAMEHTNLFFNSVMLIIVFSVAYSALQQKEIYPVNENQKETIIEIETSIETDIPKKKIVSDGELVEFKGRLNLLMKENMPYKDPEINLIKLANMMNVTPHQLSYVINTGFNENFFRYINHFRVETAKKLISGEQMNNYSLLGIAFESGFNSKTAFNNTFKKFTNQTPSEYKKSGSGL